MTDLFVYFFDIICFFVQYKHLQSRPWLLSKYLLFKIALVLLGTYSIAINSRPA